MVLEIDFNSDEALYIQLRNQIIVGIATERIREGDSLPSVRQLAEHIGINMHTVNKAYSVLKQEGLVKLDRRRGAVICLDVVKMRADAASASAGRRSTSWSTPFSTRLQIMEAAARQQDSDEIPAHRPGRKSHGG